MDQTEIDGFDVIDQMPDSSTPDLDVGVICERGQACDDNNACTQNDTCNENGECLGEPVVCNDDNLCTEDQCQPETGCVYEPLSNVPCNDDDLCTVDDMCVNGVCQAGTAEQCDDGIECTEDSCDPATGCVYEPKPESCDDENSCTLDICDEQTGCSHEPAEGDCDDGDQCTVNDQCSSGVCMGSPRSCDDENACTSDSCDPMTGCAHEDTSADCDDGVPCTIDSCDPIIGCTTELSDELCDDNNLCTNDLCGSTGCIHENTAADCSDNLDCTADSCDPILGCVFTPTDAACDDGNACTQDSCDPILGCVFTPVDAACDDGNACTQDSCDPILGCVFTPVDAACDDGNVCTQNICDLELGCIHPPNSNDCEDGNLCTQDDQCQEGVCVSGSVLQCPEPDNMCTNSICNPATGFCEEEPVECDDGIPCTRDYCNLRYGCRSTPENDRCDDNNLCTTDSCDATLGCQYEEITCDVRDGCLVSSCDPLRGCADYTPDQSLCTLEPGICQYALCHSRVGCILKTLTNCCGNGIIEEGEQCDDGNLEDGDGCSSNCVAFCQSSSCSAEGSLLKSPSVKIVNPRGADAEGRRERFGSDVSLWGTNLAVRTSYFYANVDYYNLVDNEWVLSQTIEGTPNQAFGAELVQNEDYLIISDPTAPHELGSNKGVIYSYRKSGTELTLEQTIRLDTDVTSIAFGRALALDSQKLITYAYLLDPVSEMYSMRVYIFEHTADGWSLLNTIDNVIENPIAYTTTLALDGNQLAITIPQSVDAEDVGKVQIYELQENQWSLVQEIIGEAEELFGSSLALDGDHLAITAAHRGQPYGSLTDLGGVYTYSKVDGLWVYDGLIVERDNLQEGAFFGAMDNDYFGQLLALKGDRLIVGTPQWDEKYLSDGQVHVYEWTDQGWTLQQALGQLERTSTTGRGLLFGIGVSLSGDRLAVGIRNDDQIAIDAGAVSVFDLSTNQVVCLQDGYCQCKPQFSGQDCATVTCTEDPLFCDDGNECTMNQCDPLKGCLATEPLTGTQCNTGNLCIVGDTCEEGICIANGTEPNDCDDGVSCTSDYCSSYDGCSHRPRDYLCYGNDICRTFTCDPTLGCAEEIIEDCCGNGIVEENEACDDGNISNQDDCGNLCQPPSNQCSFQCNPEGVESSEVIQRILPNNDHEKNESLNFGSAIDVDGDTLVIGDSLSDEALEDAGAVFIYSKTDMGWVQTQVLTASDPSTDAGFGESVSIDNDRLIIGAPEADQGAVYVFQREEQNWVFQQKVTYSNESGSTGRFGRYLDISGDRMLVADGSYVGGAYLHSFELQQGQWVHTQLVSRISSSPYAMFSLSMDGDYFVKGSFDYDRVVATGYRYPREGSVEIFRYSDGAWVEEKRLNVNTWECEQSCNPPCHDNLCYTRVRGFGSSVSLQEDILVVGAITSSQWYGENTRYYGGLYFYQLINGSWKYTGRTHGGNGTYLGSHIALSGDKLIASSTRPSRVKVYRLDRDQVNEYGGAVWSYESTVLEPPTQYPDEDFGSKLVLEGETIFIGSRMRGTQPRGSVFVFDQASPSCNEEGLCVCREGWSGDDCSVSD